MQYAKTTEVSPEKSRADIEAVLKRYGATAFMFGWDSDRDINLIQFTVKGRSFRMNIPMPNPNDSKLIAKLRTQAIKSRSSTTPASMIAQSRRQRWRVMLLYVKAVLEAVENELMTIEEALLPSLIVSNGMTLAEYYGPQIESLVDSGVMPPLLTMTKVNNIE
jgi:hypothetical protein